MLKEYSVPQAHSNLRILWKRRVPLAQPLKLTACVIEWHGYRAVEGCCGRNLISIL